MIYFLKTSKMLRIFATVSVLGVTSEVKATDIPYKEITELMQASEKAATALFPIAKVVAKGTAHLAKKGYRKIKSKIHSKKKSKPSTDRGAWDYYNDDYYQQISQSTYRSHHKTTHFDEIDTQDILRSK